MWTLTVPLWELILRAVIVYGFLLILLRLTGKRQIGQLAPFDLVLLLVLSNAVQNSMNGGDNSVIAGLVLAGVLIAMNGLVGWLTFRNKRLERLVEGRPEVLIHNGKLFEEALRREKLTHHELNSALREAGCSAVEDVRYALLETNGQITVIPKAGRASQNLPVKERT